MGSIRHAAIVVCCTLALLAASLGTASAQAAPPQAAGLQRYIVQLAAGTPADQVIAEKLGEHKGKVFQKYSSVINGFAIELPPQAVEALSKDGRVASIMLDPVVEASAQTTPTGVQRIGTLLNPDAKIDGVDERVNLNIAVIDSGSGPHPDLNVVGGVDCTGSGTFNDQNGHGTHVAGTIGAIDNGSGVVGVAPGARIWSVKVLNAQGQGTGSSILCGIDWITKNLSSTNIKIANMSLGGVAPVADDGNCGKTLRDSIHQAICASVAAGVSYTVAAGNSGQDAASYFPAMYDEVITVSALVDTDGKPGGLGASTTVGTDDTLASFSNYGADVDVIAPGVSIRSTVLNGGYANYNGTSMATPHVAGAAALYLVANPGSSPAQVRNALISTGGSSAWNNDRDSFKEPLIDVSAFRGTVPPPVEEEPPVEEPAPAPDVHDAEVVSISAPSSVTRGGTATVSASIRNNGTLTETVSVTFNESPGGVKGSTSVSLAPGASATVNFKWTTTSSTATGNHTVTIGASVANDSNTANNARSRTISVQAATKGMYVSSITMSSTKTSTGTKITNRVYIKSNGAAVSGAYVTIRYKDPSGATLTSTKTTNKYGYATFTRTVKAKGTYTVEVTKVSKSGYTYTPSSNVVTKKSITIR